MPMWRKGEAAALSGSQLASVNSLQSKANHLLGMLPYINSVLGSSD